MVSSQAPTGFTIMMYLVITTQFIAVTLSFLILLALPIPLFIQLKNGTFHQSAAQLRRRRGEPPYGTYNLYLVYLALVDLLYFLPTIAAEFCTLTGNVSNPRFFSNMAALVNPPPTISVDELDVNAFDVYSGIPYVSANMWLNAAIAYEVWLLLKATRCGQRITQPSLMRVNLQCGSVIFGSMVYGVFLYYMMPKVDHSSIFNFSWDTYTLIYMVVFGVSISFPMHYAIGVTIFVKCRGYMPSVNGSTSTTRDRAVRGLTLYFFRVVTVFVSIWFPAGAGAILSLYFFGFANLATHLIAAFQPILTFWMILGKDDVKKYIKDFVTLSYLSGKCTCCRKEDDTMEAADPEIADEQSSLKSVTILGYNFEDDGSGDAEGDRDDNSNGEAKEEVGMEVNTIADSSDDSASLTINKGDNSDNDVEVGSVVDGVGNSKYKSRRISGGPAAGVLATGEAYHISLQKDLARKIEFPK